MKIRPKKKLFVSCNPTLSSLQVFIQKIPTLKFFAAVPTPNQRKTCIKHTFLAKKIMKKMIFLLTHLPLFFRTVTGNKQFLFLGLIVKAPSQLILNFFLMILLHRSTSIYNTVVINQPKQLMSFSCWQNPLEIQMCNWDLNSVLVIWPNDICRYSEPVIISSLFSRGETIRKCHQ